MFRKSFITPLLAATALALTAAPAYAGKEDRARAAIAAAEAKVHTAETMGAGTSLPREAAEARAALATAREHFRADRNREAISVAIRASAMADTAIGMLQRDKERELAAANAARATDVAVAQDQAAAAQDQAAEARARAAAAERAAAASAAEAQAARIAAQSKPAEVETTVTTTQPAARAATRTTTRQPVRKTTTTRRTVTAAPATTTTTTVRAAVN